MKKVFNAERGYSSKIGVDASDCRAINNLQKRLCLDLLTVKTSFALRSDLCIMTGNALELIRVL
jgi:hypothetical protein